MISLASIAELRKGYSEGRIKPEDVIDLARARALAAPKATWINVLNEATLSDYVKGLEQIDFDHAPLWGVPFAIKDNIDLANVPTTAGCPAYAYVPERSAYVVSRLIAAGAIPIGKTNLDQFATGLTGTRSPYGSVPNAIDPAYISGGSSSGSAVAVKSGCVPFALGTDTAGSGRVPAAFNGLVGFKPTRGWWSTRGVVPACRTLDCVSVFTNKVADAHVVSEIANGFDIQEPYSRRIAQASISQTEPRWGYLEPTGLPWDSDSEYSNLYRQYVANLPGSASSIEPESFLNTGSLLYGGPWLAERIVAVGDFLKNNPESIHPITRSVIESAPKLSAMDCFRSQYRLTELRRQVEVVFEDIDVLVLPTVPKTLHS